MTVLKREVSKGASFVLEDGLEDQSLGYIPYASTWMPPAVTIPIIIGQTSQKITLYRDVRAWRENVQNRLYDLKVRIGRDLLEREQKSVVIAEIPMYRPSWED